MLSSMKARLTMEMKVKRSRTGHILQLQGEYVLGSLIGVKFGVRATILDLDDADVMLRRSKN